MIAFSVVFLAELGDKTQLMVMTLSARSKSPHMVFFGAAVALVASSLIAVLAGESLLKHIPIRYLRVVTGGFFLALGAALLLRSSQ